MHVQPSTLVGPGGPERMCERPFSTTLGVGGQFACVSGDSIAVLDTGATANLACFKWLANRKSRLRNLGIPEVTAFPAMARFFFGDGRVGSERFSADIKVGIAGRGGAFAVSALEADIPRYCVRGPFSDMPWRRDAFADIA